MRRARWFAATTVWVATTCAIASSARSQEADDAPRALLAWAAPEGCIARDELATATSNRLGRDAFGLEAQALLVDGSIVRGEGSFDARLEIRSAEGAELGFRELSQPGEDCRALDGPLALVLALLIEHAAAQIHEESAATIPDPEPPQEPQPTIEPPAIVAPSEPWMLDASIGALASVGDRPWIAGSPLIAATLRAPFGGAAEVEALVVVPGTLSVGGREVQLWSFAVGLSLCAELFALSPVTLDGCVGARAGAVFVDGFGANTERPLIQGTLRVRGNVLLAEPLGLRADVGITAGPKTLDFAADDGLGATRTVWQSSVVGGFVTLSVFLRVQ